VTQASRTPAVVISGHTMALAVVRALGEAGVPVVVLHYDARDFAQASRYTIAAIRVPHPMLDEAAFMDALVARGREFGGSVLIPASDESTVAVSRNKTLLAEHFAVACSDWEVTERFIDKSRTYEIAATCGVPAPRTVVAMSEAHVRDEAARIGYPVLLKPAESHRFYERFKRKMVRADTESELVNAYRSAVEAGLAVMVQEIIPGDDHTVVNYNAYFWRGQPLVEFTARQLRKAPPALGSPRVAISERIPEVLEPGRRILATLGFEGFACTEFKRDSRDGVYKLMEVNGRHNLSGLLAVRSGVNFPLLHYRHLAEGLVPGAVPYRAGVYWTDVLRDVGYSLAYLRRERYRLPDYLAPYARRHCDAILDRHDMGPFWARLGYLARNSGATARTAVGAPAADRPGLNKLK
jgi:D-aspartate ligase